MQRIRQNDLIEVVAGAEKGKRGQVVRVVPETDQVIVQGLNLRYKHVRRSQKHQQGGRVRREMPIHISNVAIYNALEGKGDRIGYKRLEDGRKVRIYRSTGEVIDV